MSINQMPTLDSMSEPPIQRPLPSPRSWLETDPTAPLLAAAEELGTRPFELGIVARDGESEQRWTLAVRPRAHELRVALGLPEHPWGEPRWIGLRSRGGAVVKKPYHRDPDATLPPLPASLATWFQPTVASLWSPGGAERLELYFRQRRELSWPRLLGLVGELVDSRLETALKPRNREDGFGLSLQWEEGVLRAVSVFARASTLPDEATVALAWSEHAGASAGERLARGLQQLRATGVPEYRRIRALGWTLGAGRVLGRGIFLAGPR